MKTVKNRPDALVFFARDFLALEFSKLGVQFKQYKRVYLVTSGGEAASVRLNDPDGDIYSLLDIFNNQDGSCHHGLDQSGIAEDRILRFSSTKEINRMVATLDKMLEILEDTYTVVLYMDEPVSGYSNYRFNKRFNENGAICLHFQTSWLPGLMFFSSDCAQRVIPVVNKVADGVSRVNDHIREREQGKAKPLYVINYGGSFRKVKDIGMNTMKALYRKLMRRDSFYLDRDCSAHILHSKSLLANFKGGYFNTQSIVQGSLSDGKFVLYPLHYEPEAVLCYFGDYHRQVEIAEQLLDTLPRGYRLILKEHPSQPGALNLAKWHSVTSSSRVIKVAGADSASPYLGLDLIVVSVGSTLALEAALAGRPSGVLSDVHFAGMPGVLRLGSPAEWQALIDQSPVDISHISEWYGQFLNRHGISGNFMRGGTDSSQLVSIVEGLMAKS